MKMVTVITRLVTQRVPYYGQAECGALAPCRR